MEDRWTRIRHLFRDASDLEPDQWERYLATSCPDDPALREHVLRLLRNQNRSDGFLETPAVASPSDATPDAFEGRRIGPYEIVRVIGKGGMGVVYEARDVRLDKTFALKTMNPAAARDAKIRLRFEQEARTLARLEDPHVVRIHTLHDEGPDTFIVMEYVHGPTLASYLRKRGRLPWKEVLFLTRQLLTALGKAHRLGIVHRDLKPANIMLAKDDQGRPLVKVLDFGIAKQLGEHAQTATHGAIGTLLYMAPEQVRGHHPIDGRADLYALGAIAYEMLAGELPYSRGTDEYTLRRQIVEEPAEPLDRRHPDIPSELSRLILRALAKAPADRFETAEDMLRQLQALDLRPREATPAPARTRRTWPWVVAGLGLSALAALLAWPSQQSASPEPIVLEPGTTANADSAGFSPVADRDTMEELPVSAEPTAGNEGAPLVSAPDDVPKGPAGLIAVLDTEPPPTETDDTAPPEDTTIDVPPIPASGVLLLTVSPSGDFFFDDRQVLHDLEMKDLAVDAGPHLIRIVNDTHGEWRCRLDIAAGKSTILPVDFLREVRVTVAARDNDSGSPIAGADISIDGRPASQKTPQTLLLPAGVRRIEVLHEGYLQVDLLADEAGGCYQRLSRTEVNIDWDSSGERARVEIRLEKIANGG
jgi:serine/threonine-protein kinase